MNWRITIMGMVALTSTLLTVFAVMETGSAVIGVMCALCSILIVSTVAVRW
jgi:hypothetical protein